MHPGSLISLLPKAANVPSNNVVMIDGRLLIDRLQYGVVLYGQRSLIMLVNQYASRLFARSRSFTLQGGALRCHDAFEERRLSRLLAAADEGRGGSMTIRGGGEPPVNTLAIPLASATYEHEPGEAEPLGSPVPRFGLVFGTTDVQAADTLDTFAAVYGLTGAERRVLTELARDRSPQDIASDGGVSVRTIRTQLSSIYGKAGVAGQRELLAQLLQFPPFAIH